MTHTYKVTGMTCGNCEAKVRSALMTVENITNIDIDRATESVAVTMDKHVAESELQNALGGSNSKYQISMASHNETVEVAKNWFETYKPILLIFAYITTVTFLAQTGNHHFDWMIAMRHFMAGFFLVFSFFKLLDLKGFAESYVMYDVIATRVPQWAVIYVFVELALGLAFLADFNPVITNIVTLVVMSVSLIGVLQSVLNKRKIQCACLGAVFKLPMSTVTIFEDALMVTMSGAMLLTIL